MDVKAEEQCRDFVVRCLRALDERDYETLAEGFAADGVWERGGERLVGPDEVRAAMARRPADLETQHLSLNMVVDADGADVATVRYTIAAYAQMADKPYHLHGVFRATDRLTRTAAGWRFAHRAFAPAFGAQG
ncbi:nuclear transport factor 2 family protein [Sphingomonas sp. GB1N7]|uniref:nuclear transport factor 2 family protein n=1 Tax=Parasphingomonas caseinilytica TaxID=3096158 RepID=UPI002FCA42F0